MSKSNSGAPNASMMTGTMDFFKNMWGGMPGMAMPGMQSIPGMVMPTLSVEEIDKQIKDLKSVESWLSLNLNMLQGTIQALEVQKATISTLQTMGESFTAVMQPPTTPDEAKIFKSPFAARSAAFSASLEKAAMEKSAAAAKAEADKIAAEKALIDEAAAAEKLLEQEKQRVEAAAAEEATAQARREHNLNKATTAAPSSMADAMQPLANPSAWWGMLQEQFKQAVDTAAAMSDTSSVGGTEAGTKKSSAAADVATKSTAKSAAKLATKSATKTAAKSSVKSASGKTTTAAAPRQRKPAPKA